MQQFQFRSFKLSDKFLADYEERKPDWGPLGETVFYRTYSRLLPSGQKEQWWQVVKRCVEGCFTLQKHHCYERKLPWNDKKAQRSAKTMYEKIFSFKFIPPGRSLWMMGTDFVYKHGSACLNNCGAVTTNPINSNVFVWIMDALMLGIGVGFDTRGAGTVIIKQPKEKEDEKPFVIPDSREGWIESLGHVLDAFFLGKHLREMDYSLIRKAGEPIKGFGGKASGPEPLKRLHENVKNLLSSRVGEYIQSTDIVDIANFIGVCVIAGNVRRSAEIALGNADDSEFRTMKDFRKYPEECTSHRWASNNSVFAQVGKTDYASISSSMAVNGEPGIVWPENIQKFGRLKDGPLDEKNMDKASLVNPCGEISLESYELCNLVELFPSRHESYEEFQNTIKFAYLYAKTVSLVPTHWPETNAVLLKNRRIGLSQSGIIEAFVRHGRREMLWWCDQAYSYTKQLDRVYSDWLCIPRSVKMTTVKPSGTVSLLPGVTPGIHYPHSKFYIRRMRFSDTDEIIPILKDAGYRIEQDVCSSHTQVVSFPVEEKYFDRSKDDVSIWEQAENLLAYGTYWFDNCGSITVTFKKEEGKDIQRLLESYEDRFKSISFLPMTENGYKQAPYEAITKDVYEEMSKEITKKLDFSSMTQKPIGEKFCTNDYCEL